MHKSTAIAAVGQTKVTNKDSLQVTVSSYYIFVFHQ